MVRLDDLYLAWIIAAVFELRETLCGQISWDLSSWMMFINCVADEL